MIGKYGLDIARKAERDYRHIHKFGSNPDVDISAAESIWSAGGLYPWDALAEAETIYCISESSEDTASLEIQGLDADYNPQTETVTLTGDTAVATENTFIRVFRMIYKDDQNAGTITARTVSGTGTVVAQIDEEKNQTLMAVYTVPANTRGYLVCYTVSAGKAKDAEVELFTKNFEDASFALKSQISVFENTVTQPFAVPLVLAPKTDIDFKVVTENNNTKVIVNFDLILDPI